MWYPKGHNAAIEAIQRKTPRINEVASPAPPNERRRICEVVRRGEPIQYKTIAPERSAGKALTLGGQMERPAA